LFEVSFAGTIMASIGIGVALTLIVLACALDDVWYPLFMLIPLILTPLPALLISRGSADDPGFVCEQMLDVQCVISVMNSVVVQIWQS
jgi:hypothetical protein